MTPFNQVLRVWLRRASRTERGLTAFATVLALSLLAWALLPVDEARQALGTTPGGRADATGTTQGSTNVAGSPQGSTNVAGSPQGSTNVAGSPQGSTNVAGSPQRSTNVAGSPQGSTNCPTGTGRGVTDTEIRVAFTIADLGGSNEVFGLPSPDEQESDYDLLTKSVNAAGGICGRSVVPRYYSVNQLDAASAHQACLTITAAQPFIVMDVAIGPNEAACFAQRQTPYFSTGETSDDARRYYPYVYAPTAADLIYRNAIFGWMQRGAFNDGKKIAKIGVIYHSCVPIYYKAMFQALRDTGVPDDRLSTFDFGDCSGFASPSTHQQAVLQFQRDGVTHVLVGFMAADFSNFTRIAQQQGFKPQYRIADPGTLLVSYGAFAPDWNNLDGAKAMVSGRFGEERTPGFQPEDATQRCDAVFTTAGRPPTYQQQVGFGGFACMFLWTLKAGVEHAQAWTPDGFAQGLGAAGALPDPYPLGPTNFAPGELWSGRYWRELTASASCRCYTVAGTEFQPGFP